MMTRGFILFLALLTTQLQGGQMIVFGDSLSDGGYFFGARFTDPGGDLWHEALADTLNLNRATTGLLGSSGLNFSVGGASVSGLQAQVNRYAGRYRWQAGDLCTLWIGGNDIRSSPGQDMTALTDEIGVIIGQLASLGVDHIVVPNLPDIGAIPEFQNDAMAALARSHGTAAFNAALAAELSARSAQHGIIIDRLDVFSLFQHMLELSGDFGFVHTRSTLQDHSGDDPTTYVFWDEIHPTARSHYLLSSAAVAILEPTRPIEVVSAFLEPELTFRQTWIADPTAQYSILSGSDLDALTPALALSGQPSYTVEIPKPALDRGFYQTRRD